MNCVRTSNIKSRGAVTQAQLYPLKKSPLESPNTERNTVKIITTNKIVKECWLNAAVTAWLIAEACKELGRENGSDMKDSCFSDDAKGRSFSAMPTRPWRKSR